MSQTLSLHRAYPKKDLRKITIKYITRLGKKMPNNSAVYFYNKKTMNATMICKFSGGVWKQVVFRDKNLSTWLRINLTIDVLTSGKVRKKMINEIMDGHPIMLKKYAEKTEKSIRRNGV